VDFNKQPAHTVLDFNYGCLTTTPFRKAGTSRGVPNYFGAIRVLYPNIPMTSN